jgi:membrane-associated phospholipid phosphatase
MNHSSEPSTEAAHIPAIPPPSFFFAGSAVLLVFFATWTGLVFQGEALDGFDKWAANSMHQYTDDGAHGTLTQGMIFLTDIGGVAAAMLMAIMGAIWQNAIGRRYLAFAWFGVILGCAILNSATKYEFDRDRPPENLRHRAVLESNKSYPSGHSMGSAVGYGMLAYALILPQRRRPRRIAALLWSGGMIVAVGLSRVYLRAHWFSDVVAGWTIGLCWLFFCIAWLELYRRKRLVTDDKS